MQELFNASPELVASGLVPGLPLALRPLWNDGLGITFSGAAVESYPGREQIFAIPDGVPLDLVQAFVDTTPRIYLGTTSGVLKYVDGVGTTTLLSGDYGAWYLTSWGEWLLATDGINPALVSKNTGTLATLGGTTFTSARILEKYSNFMVAMNTSNGVAMVEWSALDNPEQWDPVTYPTAGNYPIRDMDSGIQATAAIGSLQAIYSSDQMFLMNYVSDLDVIMSIKPAVPGLGAVSRRSVVADGRFNWGLMQRGAYRTDGVGKQFIDEPRMRKILREQVNWDAQEQIFGSLDETRHMVQWHLPMTAGSFKTVAYDYDAGSWTYPHADVRVSGEEGILSGVLLGSETAVSLVGNGVQEASWIQTIPLVCGTRDKNKTFQRLRLDFEAGEGVVVEVAYLRESIKETPVFSQSYALEEDVPLQEQDALAIVLRFSAPVGSYFTLSGFAIFGEYTGNTA